VSQIENIGGTEMKKFTLATLVASGLTLAIGLAGPALADDGTVALPPGGPVAVYPQGGGGTNPYTPYGVDPYVPFGVWAQH
jgi:hypothetical protein